MNSLNDIQFDKAKWQVDSEGLWFCQRVIRQHEIHVKRFVAEMKEKIYTLSVKLFREKRSLDANAYAWVLMNKLAEAIADNVTSEDVYREFVRKIGPKEILPVRDIAVERFMRDWECKGKGWVCEVIGKSKIEGYTNVIAYYGSSTYDSKEMSMFIDAIVEECKEYNIPTDTPEQIAKMKELWTSCKA